MQGIGDEKFWARLPNQQKMDDLKREGRRQSDLWRGRIGSAVRRARERAAMTQGELAVLIGADIATVSKTELGKTVPDFATIETMADILGVSVDELTGRAPKPPVDASATAGQSPLQVDESRVLALERRLAAALEMMENAVEAAKKPQDKLSPKRKRADRTA